MSVSFPLLVCFGTCPPFTLTEITSWNSLLSNVWVQLAVLVLLSIFFLELAVISSATVQLQWHHTGIRTMYSKHRCVRDGLRATSRHQKPLLRFTADLWNVIGETCLFSIVPVPSSWLENKKFLWSQRDNEGSGPTKHKTSARWLAPAFTPGSHFLKVSAKQMKVSVKAACLKLIKHCQVGNTFSLSRLCPQ